MAWYHAGMYTQETHDIKIHVEPRFMEEESDPVDNHYVWAYHVSIENDREDTIQLMTRQWLITDSHGMVHEVAGDGVVGEQPVLHPGDSFSYVSGTPLCTPSGMMLGRYMFETDSNELLEALVPPFSLDSPYDNSMVN